MRSKLWGKALCSFAGAVVLALGVSATTLAGPDDEFVTQDDLKALKGEINTLRDELKSIKSVKPDAASDVTGNVYSTLSRKIKLGGQIRARYENWFTFGDFSGSGGSSNVDHTLLRTRLNVDADINDYLRAFIELQDSHVFGEEGSTTPTGIASTNGKGDIEMLQGYTEIKSLSPVAPALKNFSVLFGRWRLLYGKERFVGPLDWVNTGRRWDGARVRWSGEDSSWVDGFFTSIKEPTVYSKTSDKDEIFWGVYGHCTALKDHEIEPYFLGRNSTAGAGSLFGIPGTPVDTENRYMAAIRFEGKPVAVPGLDYEVEAGYQFGNVKVGGSSFDIQDAYSIVAVLGYTFMDVPWTPRIGGQFNHATGDEDAADDEINTFDQFYPTGHAHLGYIDLVGRQNIFDYVAQISCKPTKKLTMNLDFHWFELDEEKDDVWYGVGGTMNGGWTGAGSSPDEELGQEVDLTIKYAMFKNFTAVFGYSHFFAGDFIDDPNVVNTSGSTFGGSDADWFYLMTILNF